MQLLRVYCIEASKSTTVPVPSGKPSPRGQSTAQKIVNRGPEELYVVLLAPGQGVWAMPTVPEVAGADNVVEDESAVIDVNIIEPVWMAVAGFGDPAVEDVVLFANTPPTPPPMAPPMIKTAIMQRSQKVVGRKPQTCLE